MCPAVEEIISEHETTDGTPDRELADEIFAEMLEEEQGAIQRGLE